MEPGGKKIQKEVMAVPAISVIVPVYNGEKYIENCVQNIRKQTLKDVEIIFVDDGSTDGTLEHLRRLESEAVKVFTQKNTGAGGARNYGLPHATGDYVIFLDVDDTWANSGVLELLYNKAKCNGALICGGSMICPENPLRAADKYEFSREGFVSFDNYQFDFGFQRFIFFRTFLLEHQLRFPPYRIYEDPVFLAKAMTAAGQFYAVPDAVYVYSGAHQVSINAAKTVDYLHGLRDNLRLSVRHGYAKLHLVLYERLISTASYYAECNIRQGSEALHRALIDANAAVDPELLREAGLEIEDTFVIPALKTVWRAAGQYFYLRERLNPRYWLKHIRRN